jgi:hypothetical protein
MAMVAIRSMRVNPRWRGGVEKVEFIARFFGPCWESIVATHLNLSIQKTALLPFF